MCLIGSMAAMTDRKRRRRRVLQLCFFTGNIGSFEKGDKHDLRTDRGWF
jgi:hypothetical protein